MITPEIEEKIIALKEKFSATGQDLNSYLEGLLYADYLDYWDYIHLDVLLNLQTPRTAFPDEKIFIMYHQITELYFNLALHEIKQACDNEALDVPTFIKRVKRVNNYLQHLIHSFNIMIDGMDKEQFLKFRMALLPASGFQSAQYRMIELCSTDLKNIVAFNSRGELDGKELHDCLNLLYWRQGATELKSGSKTFTLRRFEEKYNKEFHEMAVQYSSKNLWQKYLQLSESDRNNPELIHQLRELDKNANVRWPTMHLRAAANYLHRNPEDIKATGGTNWQKYLPPVQQRIVFYPSLFNDAEKESWGTILD